MSLSIESLSQPISENLPSGENLEYDPKYMEMEKLFQSKPESSLKGYVQEDNGPDWKGVGKLAGELLQNTRDLRVQAYATIASLYTKDIIDFRDNLELLKTYLETFWDTVYPQLDPEDDNDPTQRLNILQMLNRTDLIAMAFNKTRLVELRGVGQISLRDVEVAQGRESPDQGEEILDIKLVRQAFASSEPEQHLKLDCAVSQSIELLSGIDQVWQQKTGDKAGLDFDITVRPLKRIASIIKEFSPVPAENEATQEQLTPGDVPSASAVSGVINSRADVIRVLDRVCDYYDANEPSSPIPLLLRRAQRLVEKSFMEILEDMVPDGVQQAKIVSGNTDED